jgi:hypothetical protein
MEETQPGIFHIHIDARELPKELHSFAINELCFTDTDFSGHPEGYQHFEPNNHLTLKLGTKDEFQNTWTKLEKKANSINDFVGYLEGEYITIDELLPEKEYSDLPVPFSVTRRQLKGGEAESFRQTELHLTMEKSRSNFSLQKKLLDSGLYGAYVPKKDGEFLVLTMQGYLKDISKLIDVLREYLIQSGGFYRCTLKEERAIKYKLYGIAPENLPEIADRIMYT